MNKIKEFFKRHLFILAIIFGIILAGCNYLIYPVFIKNDMDLIEVPVAANDLFETSKITSNDITTIYVTKEFISSDIVVDKDELLNLYIKNDCALAKGSFFYNGMLTDEETTEGKIARELKNGEIAYTIEIDEKEAADTYKTNQVINIYCIIEYENENELKSYAYGEVAKNCRIVNVEETKNDGKAKYVTVAITDEENAYIHIAEKIGTICYHLPYQNEDSNYYDVESFRQFILNRSEIFNSMQQIDDSQVETQQYAPEQ